MGREHRRISLSLMFMRGLVVSLVAAIALAAVAASHHSPPDLPPLSSVPAVSATTRLAMPGLFISSVTSAGVRCVSDVAFSPTGAYIAIVGTTVACDETSASSSSYRLVIYGAVHGEVQTAIALDELLYARVTGLERSSIGAMRFAGLGWSPSGARYAVAFAAFDRHAVVGLDNVVSSGLLLVDIDGALLTMIQGDAGLYDSGTGTYAGLPGWDLRDGEPTAAFIPEPALVYAWQHATQPQPIVALDRDPIKTLPVTAGPRYPIGNPLGDAIFTVWQPGVLYGPAAAPAPAGPGNGAFVTHFLSWSPDGDRIAYMVAGVTLVPPRHTDGPAGRPGSVPLMSAPPQLLSSPPRDPALIDVQREIGPSGWAALAWNPMGSLLASVNCAGAVARLKLRETGTGALIDAVTLSPEDGSICSPSNLGRMLGPYATPNPSLAWSPDGSRLLLANQITGDIQVWALAK